MSSGHEFPHTLGIVTEPSQFNIDALALKFTTFFTKIEKSVDRGLGPVSNEFGSSELNLDCAKERAAERSTGSGRVTLSRGSDRPVDSAPEVGGICAATDESSARG